jgi:hypothetical protein
VDAEAIFSTEISLVNERLSSTDNHLESDWHRGELPLLSASAKTDVQSRYCSLPIDKVSQLLLHNPLDFR